MAKLHDLTGEYLALQAAIEGADDEGAVLEALARIGEVEDDLERKHLSIAFVIRNMDSDVEAYAAEALRISEKRARLEKRVDGLRRFALAAMTIAGVEKIKGPSFTISRRKNPPKAVIEDEDLVPPAFCHPLPPPPPPPRGKVDLAKVLAALLTNDDASLDLMFIDWACTEDAYWARTGEPRAEVDPDALIEADLRFMPGMDVPDDYRHQPCGAPDKKAILNASKLGEVVPGTRVEQGERLAIT